MIPDWSIEAVCPLGLEMARVWLAATFSVPVFVRAALVPERERLRLALFVKVPPLANVLVVTDEVYGLAGTRNVPVLATDPAVRPPSHPNDRVPVLMVTAPVTVMEGSLPPEFPIAKVGVDPVPPIVKAATVIVSFPIVTV